MVKSERTPLAPWGLPLPVWGGSFVLAVATLVVLRRRIQSIFHRYMVPSRVWGGLGWGLLLLTACSGAAVATPRPVLITIGGSTAMQPVLQALTTDYTRR